MRGALFTFLVLLAAPAEARPIAAIVTAAQYDPDAKAYFDQIAKNGASARVLPRFRKGIAEYLRQEKGYGNWNAFDQDYIFVTNDKIVAGTNLAQPTLYGITWTVGSGTFSVPKGLSGDGAAFVGDTGVNENALVRATQNNVFVDADKFFSSNTDAQYGAAASNATVLAVGNAAASINIRPATATALANTGLTFPLDLWAWRTSSSTASSGENGTTINNGVASTSAALTSAHLVICESNAVFCPSTSAMYSFAVGSVPASVPGHVQDVRNRNAYLGAVAP